MAKTKSKRLKQTTPASRYFSIILLGIWLIYCAVAITFPGYSWLSPKSFSYSFFLPSWETAIFLLAVMFIVARFSADKKNRPGTDIPLSWARVGLFSVLILGAFLCLHHMSLAMGEYGDDTAFDIYQVRRMKDLDNFWGAFVFDNGLLPLWPYTALAIWRLLPDLTGLIVQRLTGCFFELGTAVVLYLIGKEIAGRRMGLYCAVLVVLSKPLLSKVVSGYSCSVLVFCMDLVFLTTFQLFRRDKQDRFIWWGVAVGLSAYSSFPIQPFVMTFVFASLLMIWWADRKKMKLKKTGGLFCGFRWS